MRTWVVALAITQTACFPHNARHRQLAKLTEGAALVAGVTMQFVARDPGCMETTASAIQQCDADRGQLDKVGLGLIFAGLLGFAVTVMTSPSEQPPIDDIARPEPAFAAPQSFCSALAQANTNLAQAAAGSYVRSIGAVTAIDIREALIAWLSRQACVVVEEDLDSTLPSISFTAVHGETKQRYLIDLSASPTVMVFPQ